MPIPDDEDLVLEAELPEPADAAPESVEPVPADDVAAPLPQIPRDPAAEPGDPPPAVRGVAQELVDAPGDAADDGARRWDPRTVAAPEREGA